IIASRTPEELKAIKQAYEEEYGSNLVDDVVGVSSGYYQRMLVVLLQANRDADTGVVDGQGVDPGHRWILEKERGQRRRC
ncbi:hypothetical protein OFC41_30950, partial [Escherichia coli]|nr:hypothetical protein [Escherichia coli]